MPVENRHSRHSHFAALPIPRSQCTACALSRLTLPTTAPIRRVAAPVERRSVQRLLEEAPRADRGRPRRRCTAPDAPTPACTRSGRSPASSCRAGSTPATLCAGAERDSIATGVRRSSRAGIEEAPPDFQRALLARGKDLSLPHRRTPTSPARSCGAIAWHVPRPLELERDARGRARVAGEHDFARLLSLPAATSHQRPHRDRVALNGAGCRRAVPGRRLMASRSRATVPPAHGPRRWSARSWRSACGRRRLRFDRATAPRESRARDARRPHGAAAHGCISSALITDTAGPVSFYLNRCRSISCWTKIAAGSARRGAGPRR